MLNLIRKGPATLALMALCTFGCGDDVAPQSNTMMGAGGGGGNGGRAGSGGQAGEPAKDMGMPRNLCGNGRRDPGEQCDDGNLVNEDGCDDMCRVEMLCGNGTLNDGEECDEEAADCRNCEVQPTDVTRGGVFPGGFQAGSFDRFTIRVPQDLDVVFEASDGAIGCPGDMEMELFEVSQRGELRPIEYDFGSGPGLCPRIEFFLAPTAYELVVRGVGGSAVADYSLSVRLPGSCGDNRVNIGEDCDDGNTSDGDGCSGECVVESSCGDGAVTGRETCDDGNRSNDDGCDEDCSVERMTLARGNEQVDSAIAEASSDTFSFTADGPSQIRAYTGDGRGGCPRSADTVMALRRVADGAVVAENDDAPGRGFCAGLEAEIEAGEYELRVTEAFENDPIERYTLEFDLSQNVTAGGFFNGAFIENGNDLYRLNVDRRRRLQLRTGDGMGACPGDTYMRVFKLDADGRRRFFTDDDDGGEGVCSQLEQEFEPGEYIIEVTGFNGAVIEAYIFGVLSQGNCGDGTVNLGEECDDRNLADGDGCSRDCRIEVPCGNGRVEDGEECDDGNDVSGDGCDAGCSLEDIDVINGAIKLDGVIGVGGQDTFHFVADATTRLFVSTGDGNGICPEDMDTVMTLNRVMPGAMAQMVEENDDAEGFGLCSALDVQIEAGQYELVVRSFRDDVGIPDYVLDFFMAQELGQGGELNGAFVAGGDDVFTLNLEYATAAQFLTGDGQGGCPGDTRLVLQSIDPMGAPNLIADIGDAGNCARIQRSLDQGFYRLTASGFEGAAIPRYVLSAILAPEPNECGNGRLEVGEDCDDGNRDAGDGCSAMCTAE